MSQDTDLILVFEEKRGTMKFDSRMILPAILLNKILVDLSKENDLYDLDQYMEIEQWSETEINYVFNFSEIELNTTQLFQPAFETNARYIRA